jgi:hypothetical protein
VHGGVVFIKREPFPLAEDGELLWLKTFFELEQAEPVHRIKSSTNYDGWIIVFLLMIDGLLLIGMLCNWLSMNGSYWICLFIYPWKWMDWDFFYLFTREMLAWLE